MARMRKMLRAKIHRAVVTDANVEYEGSITIPPHLMDASEMHEYEAVHVWNITAGTRFETYAIAGEPGSSDICVNGAAAHLVTVGDRIIIAAFCDVEERELRGFQPKLIFVDENNRQTESRPEVPGPRRITAAG